MMGVFYIEDKMHQMIGKLLQDSEWSYIITQAQVLTSVRAQSVLDEHHIKHTRNAHPVSLMGLYTLRQKSYPYTARVFKNPLNLLKCGLKDAELAILCLCYG